MSRCFRTHSNLSAKEYTNKKSDLNLFCSLRKSFLANNKKSIGTNVACLKDNGKISSFMNQSSQLKIKKGYEYFSQNYRFLIISSVIFFASANNIKVFSL